MSFTVREAQHVLAQKFLLEEGVTGVSHACGRLIVYVESLEHARMIPRTLMGFPVEVRVSGRIRTLQPAWAGRTARFRPVCGGCSIGSVNVSAGTNATRVIDRATRLKMFLSNRHIFWGDTGVPITQPAPYDGGTDEDVVAYIGRYVEIKPPPDTNLVDAALGEPVDQSIVSDEILGIGVADGVAEPRVGMKIKKSGRTCGVAEAVVIDTNATVKVEGYPDIGVAIFEDTVITTVCGLNGDSGSLAVSADTGAAVGLLFAGSDVVTCFNKITNVCRLLDVEIPRAAAAQPAAAHVLIIAAAGLAGAALLSISTPRV